MALSAEEAAEQRNKMEALEADKQRLLDELDAARRERAPDSSRSADGQGDSRPAGQHAASSGGAAAGGFGTGEPDRRRSFGVGNSPSFLSPRWGRSFSAALGASLKYPSNSGLTERVAWKNRLEMHLRQEGLSRVILREA
ncbi:unnamed protein product, partial [Scytosiphon promiscuus]